MGADALLITIKVLTIFLTLGVLTVSCCLPCSTPQRRWCG